jgi:hypothetical protein
VPLRQNGGDFLDEPTPDHFIRPARDALVKNRPRHRQNNVPRVEQSLTLGFPLPVGKRVPAEQRDLDGTRGALSATAAKAGIEASGPAEQLDRLQASSEGIEQTPSDNVEGRFGKQTVR